MLDSTFYTLLLDVMAMQLRSSLVIHKRYSRNQKLQVGNVERIVNKFGMFMVGMLIYIRCYEEYLIEVQC